MCFGMYLEHKLIGFARVVTDHVIFAYLCDVFILPEHQGKGYGKLLMQYIHEHPELKTMRRWFLATKDAHGLYAQYGYTPLKSPERWMECFRGDL
jgi:GNAT superfamily N-acetyltransferase